MKNQSIDRLILFFILLGLFFLFFLPPFDPDLGWQLRCGQQIWQERELCAQNTFSVLLENYYWTDARSLYQALLLPFYHLFGLFGLSLLNSFLMLIGLLFWLSLSGKREIKIILLPFVILFSWLVLGFGIRNQLMSLFFLFVLLKLIEEATEGKTWFFFLPLIMFFWANGHGGFIIGVILLIFFLLERTIRLFLRPRNIKSYLITLGVVMFSLGATLLNPFGYQIYLEGWRHFSVVPLAHLIAEWVPPHFWYQVAIIAFLAISFWVLYQTKKESLTIFRLLALIFLAFIAFKARRDLAFFFFFAGYVISLVKIKSKNLQAFAFLAAMTIFTFGFLLQLPRTLMANSSWQKFCLSGKTRYPYQATEFLKEQSEGGNIFNAYELGGFLIWQLPKHKVFVDGRMPAWKTPSGKSPYTIYLETLQTQPGWQETLEEYKIDWLFVYPGTFMDLKIRDYPAESGWQEVYRDELIVIYKKIK